ncbi:uncharacterized protein LOC141631329 [Silene latifolia]|uniref:uncharacterized protein LOC141631329 n=1 Tax=Silene latifolia TaxID=37657 RepID=UPI003D773DF5
MVPVPTPQCIDVDEVHAGTRLCLMVTPGGSQEWVRNIATEFTPTIGQTFPTLDEGIQFYETYAIACGFEPRKSSTRRFRSGGDIRTKLIVCHRKDLGILSRQYYPLLVRRRSQWSRPIIRRRLRLLGLVVKLAFSLNLLLKKLTKFKCHSLLLISFMMPITTFFLHSSIEFQKSCRNLAFQHKQTIVDNCKVNIGPTSTFWSIKEYVDGYENIGACLTDFKNFGREIKYFIAARRNYALYGEAVTFDPTYSTNKYDMIFAPFTGVDHHKKSVTFSSSLMSRENDLPAIFTTAAHRYCMWHIMKKLPEKLGTTVTKEIDFVTRLNFVVWDSNLEPSDFEERWCSLISEF